MENIYQVSRFATEITLKITESVFNENTNYEPFIEVQKALKKLKQDPQLKITTIKKKKYKLRPEKERIITLTVNGKRKVYWGKDLKKIRKTHYKSHLKPYLRIKNHQTMKNIYKNKVYGNHSQYPIDIK